VAVSCVLIGASLVLLAVRRPGVLAAELLALSALPLVLVTLLGHLYGVPRLTGLGLSARTAQAAVLVIALLVVGIVLVTPGSRLVALLGSNHAGGVLARRLIPLGIVVPAALGWLRLEGQRAGLYGVQTGLALLTSTLIAIFVVAIILVARRLELLDASRRREEREVRRLNAELEQRVAHRTGELQASNRELESFNYTVSHDLRAPLRAMDGFSEMLLQGYGGQLDLRGRHYLERIRAGAQRMGTMIDELLQLSRVSRAELHRERVDISALAREIAAGLQRSQPERAVQWAITDGLEVSADRELARIVLENLLSNAWKFTSTHERARIEFGAIDHNGCLEMFVRDDGAGFDMQHAEQLFKAFRRLHREDEFPGVGIGLASAHRIITHHGGHMRADGAVGRGATFTFTLESNEKRHEPAR